MADAKHTAVSEIPHAIATQLPLNEPSFREQLERVLGLSDFAREVICREPSWLARGWRDGLLEGAFERAEASKALSQDLAGETKEAPIMAALRRHRHRQLLAILWRDVNGRADLEATLAALTGLAEELIDAALVAAEAHLFPRYGKPTDARGEPQRAVILGMGKLGGGELNFSSDVDLIFAYREAGYTDGARRLSNEEYFTRLVRSVVRWLAERTADGFVYRVDLRLRPFGEAGRAALSFASMEQYYQRDGRDWERYALIKARPVAGDRSAGEELLASLRPFIYRRYLDYAAFDALRDMKAMIRSEVERRGLDDDIKLGPGGIREIEFTVQAFQLVRGGQEADLRDTRLRPVLRRLGVLGLLSSGTAVALDQSYCFLRTLENRIQQIADRQTHRMPADARLRRRISTAMGYDDPPELRATLKEHRATVRAAFDEVFEQAGHDGDDRWRIVWDGCSDGEGVAQILIAAGFSGQRSTGRLMQLRGSAVYRGLGERARRRVDRLMPHILQACAGGARPDRTLKRLLQILTRIAARTAYVAMLCERPQVLEQLVTVCRRSSWITELIARQPALLDELLTQRPDTNLQALLEARLDAAEDAEAELNALRKIQQSAALAIAVARTKGSLEPAAVARRLSGVADTILTAVHRLAWRDLVKRHGAPASFPGLAIIGYGTLGGRELNFDSDLDLVFLFVEPGEGVGEGGDGGGLGGLTFFSRLSQRILHMLTTTMASGALYRVDTRLRPNGQAGFLVSSLEAFTVYQREQAWTWELQALSRARWIAGDERIRAPFEALRSELLQRRRDPAKLASEVGEMREKMRAPLDRSDEDSLDLKHGRGGRVDIEFITQFARLAWSHEHPSLARETGTLETLRYLAAASLMPQGSADTLLEAYEAYQGMVQDRALQGQPAKAPWKIGRTHAKAVTGIWQKLFPR